MCSKRTSIVLLSERFTDERGVVIFGPTADRELQGVLGELDWSVAGDGTMMKKLKLDILCQNLKEICPCSESQV